jgi:solute:Na+ symporter, SSS family
MNLYDYLIIAFFFVFMLVIGAIAKRKITGTDQFFRSGGSMTWWMVGASSFVSTFSAWTFVGLAGAVYSRGIVMLVIPIANILGSIICMLFFAARFRRMRVITWVEALRDRFGPGTEQLYANLTVLTQLVTGGTALYILAVFMSPLFGTGIVSTIVVIGGAVMIISTAGGAWAVLISNFVQSLIIIGTVAVTMVLVLRLPEVGGLSGFIERVPSTHWDWGFDVRDGMLLLFALSMTLNGILNANSLSGGCSRLIAVKNERHAVLSQIIPTVGFMILPVLVFIPTLAATFLFPDIKSQFPQLNFPKEAAYVAVAMKALPSGMLGLLACSMFAATMTTVDAAINVNAGIFVKNIYLRIWRKGADDREAMVAARLFSVVIGLTLIGGGILFSTYKSLPLFELGGILGTLLAQPLLIPLFFGIFVRKVPGWAANSTVVVGFVTSVVFVYLIKPSVLLGWFGVGNFNGQESDDIAYIIPNMVVTIITTGWFFFTRWFYRPSANAAECATVDAFFERQRTPIDPVAENIPDTDGEQARLVGTLCCIYGAAVLLGVLIPNEPAGRMAFGGVAFILMATGMILKWLGAREKKHARTAVQDRVAVPPLAAACETGAGRSRTSGFTLVELLVVIAIVGILAALVLVGAKSSRERANLARCASNLRTIGVAALTYAGEHKRQFPPLPTNPSYWDGYVVWNNPGGKAQWINFGLLYGEGYIADGHVFYCPTALEGVYDYDSQWATKVEGQKVTGGFRIGYLQRITDRQFTLLDEGKPHILMTDIYVTDYSQHPYANKNTVGQRYVNVLYSDGHVDCDKSGDRWAHTPTDSLYDYWELHP